MMTIERLPAVNATLNGIATCLLVLGWICIRSDRIKWHMTMMVSALIVSTVFLACYLTYHFSVTAVTKFTTPGLPKLIYFAILIPHIILAFATVPLVITTLIPAFRRRFDKHRRIARWTLPVWLYVSVTGVLVYLMLYQWYPPGS
jgi:putative membrane protein